MRSFKGSEKQCHTTCKIGIGGHRAVCLTQTAILKNQPDADASTRRLHYKDRIDRVIEYIGQNSNQKLNLDMLADVSGFSKCHFTRIFTSIEGVTPVAFVNRERSQKAVYFLAETNKTILEISNQCGFE